jgi:hypothetical protein
MYEQVAVLDVASMHPTSIVKLNLFGPYTKKFEDLIKARIAIKRKDFAAAREMLDGRLAPYLTDESGADQLAYALKIVINIVYGLTSAKFNNPFRDIRNIDNIVAKRGALFMIDLKQELQKRGVQVVHIKTDSIKIPNITSDLITFVTEFGATYGYEFEHEETYDKFCLVNDAVYVAGVNPVPFEDHYPKWKWTAVGAQFQHPYVFKTLFSGEPIEFDDYCEGRSVVKGTMYLDMQNLDEPDPATMRHVGKTGLYVPVLEGGGKLYRVHEDKYYAVSGTKGHLWLEASVAKTKPDLKIDYSYFEKLVNTAVEAIEKFGPYEQLVPPIKEELKEAA